MRIFKGYNLQIITLSQVQGLNLSYGAIGLSCIDLILWFLLRYRM